MDVNATTIKNTIVDNGYKQRFIAEKIGISKNRMNRICNGKIQPYAAELFSIAKILGKPIDYFF